MSDHTRWQLPGDPTPAKRMLEDELGAESLPDDAIELIDDVVPLDEKVWSTAELRSARSKAQGRAKTQLAHEFRMRYRMLYQQELEREGLTVTRHRRLGYPASKTIAREAANPEIPINGPYYYPDHHDDEEGDT